MTLILGDDELAVAVEQRTFRVPVGIATVAGELTSDPPRPEQLTNVIGEVIDHIDDVLREVPTLFDHEVVATGALVQVLADVEAGSRQRLPRPVRRDDIEELFRTLATEPAADRRHNPGLPEDEVERIVAACCILVAVARRLHLEQMVLA